MSESEVFTSVKTKELNTTKFGIAVTQIVKLTTGVAEAAFSAESGTTVNDKSTISGYTIQQVVKALQLMGILT